MASPVFIGATVQMEEAATLIDKILAKTADIRPVLDGPVDRSVTAFFERQFKTEGAFGGDRWKPLAPLTIHMKSQRGRGRAGPSRVLQDTRSMYGSFTKRGSPMGVRVVQPLQLIRGSRDENAVRAQEGWKTNKIFGRPRKMTKVVAPRMIVPRNMPAPVTRAWEGMIEAYITEGSLKYQAF